MGDVLEFVITMLPKAHAPSTVFEAQSVGAQNTPDSQACYPTRSLRSGYKSSVTTRNATIMDPVNFKRVFLEENMFFSFFRIFLEQPNKNLT